MLIVTSAAASGCYEEVRLSAPLASGAQVAATLSPENASSLAPVIGPRARRIRGYLDSDSDTALVVRLTSVERESGRDESWAGERVSLPRDMRSSLITERFSRSRTGTLAVAIALGLGALRGILQAGGFVGGSGPTGPSAPR